MTLPGQNYNLENELRKLNSSNKPSRVSYKMLITKSVIVYKKAKRNGLETVNSSMWRFWTGSQFIYLNLSTTLDMHIKQFKFLHRRIALNSFCLILGNKTLLLLSSKPKKHYFIFSGKARSQRPFGIAFNNF